MVDRKLLRRVAAILYHRRAGFSANGMGVWRVPEDEILDVGARMAAVRGISHCYQRPDLRGLALQRLHHGPRPLQGGVRRDPRRRSPTSTACTATTAPSSTPRPSSRRSASTTSPTTTRAGRLRTRISRSEELVPRERSRLMPGGVNSPGAGDALDRPRSRSSSSAARAPTSGDVDGNRYVDWVCSWGPLILGPRASGSWSRRSGRPPAAGTSYGAPTAGEVELADEVVDRFPSVEMVRMTSSGTEATMSRAAPRAGRHRPRARSSSSPAPTTATSTGCSPRPARASPPRASRRARGSPRRRRRTR